MIRYKLGKLAPKIDSRTLKFKTYLTNLPTVPTSIDWTGKVPDYLCLKNDELGDCTIAGALHLEMVWTSQSTVEFVPSDDDALTAYEQIAGYNPNDPNSDQGAMLVDVLNAWRNNGIANHKIQAYVQIEPTNLDHVKAAIALFGGCYIGVQLPADAQDAFSNGQPWSNISCTDIEGGHCITLNAYTPDDLTAITWGQKQLITNAWLSKYMDECYAVLSSDWIAATGNSPSGFNLAQLYADLRLIT